MRFYVPSRSAILREKVFIAASCLFLVSVHFPMAPADFPRSVQSSYPGLVGEKPQRHSLEAFLCEGALAELAQWA